MHVVEGFWEEECADEGFKCCGYAGVGVGVAG